MLTNFLVFFCYFELSMFGVMDSLFFFVMILHFCHSFCFQGHIYLLHVKIMAMDKYRDEEEQHRDIVNKKCCLYMVCFAAALFVVNILTSNFTLFFLFGCIWMPQIMQNIKKNQRKMPFMPYATTQ